MLQEEFDIPIYAHKKAIPDLKKEYSYPMYRQMTWGERRLPVEAEKVPDIIFSNTENYRFEVFPMPGHAPDQFALIENEQQWAFVADAVQPKYRMLFGNSSDIQEDIAVIYESIHDLYNHTEGMDELKIFSSSRGVFMGREFLEEKLGELENMHRKTHNVYNKLSKKYDKEERLMKKVLREVLGRESAVGKLTRGDLSKMNLVKSLLQWQR
jgi:glyoxylase-like metal-dependent hydrolase (beta-lactamase superfamily II)